MIKLTMILSRNKIFHHGKSLLAKVFFVLSLLVAADAAVAQKKYDVGASDTEIKIGNTTAYSGPVSGSTASVGKTEAAFFKMINDKGGINGRKINFITYDDAYSPPKTVEQVRKLVESDEVLATFSILGTAPNMAVRKYLNAKQVPQLLSMSAAASLGDPQNFPWTIGVLPSSQSEGRVYARYILENLSNGKIAVLYQNDDYGKDYLKGLKDGLGDKVSMIIAELSYETTEPTIDSQVARLKASGADILLLLATPRFGAQALRKSTEMGWNATRFIVSGGSSGLVNIAGPDSSKGLLSADYRKDVSDPRSANNPGAKEYFDFLDKYMPGSDKTDAIFVSGYMAGTILVQIIVQCGDELTRENLMKQAANLKDFSVGVLIDGIKINTSPTDFNLIEQFQIRRFDGEKWGLFGPILSVADKK